MRARYTIHCKRITFNGPDSTGITLMLEGVAEKRFKVRSAPWGVPRARLLASTLWQCQCGHNAWQGCPRGAVPDSPQSRRATAAGGEGGEDSSPRERARAPAALENGLRSLGGHAQDDAVRRPSAGKRVEDCRPREMTASCQGAGRQRRRRAQRRRSGREGRTSSSRGGHVGGQDPEMRRWDELASQSVKYSIGPN
jgi:hypothetical protein